MRRYGKTKGAVGLAVPHAKLVTQQISDNMSSVNDASQSAQTFLA